MFAMQGHRIVELSFDVLRIALPLLVDVVLMFGLALWLSRRLGFGYEATASVAALLPCRRRLVEALKHR